jgi:hypothetical protein
LVSGGILRGRDGEWLRGFSKFIGKGSAYVVAELWGMLEGLSFAKCLNFSATGSCSMTA